MKRIANVRQSEPARQRRVFARTPGRAARRVRSMVLLSGGIDSAVAAHHLIQKGHDVTALHLDHGQLAAEHEHRAARGVAKHLGVRLITQTLSGLPNASVGFVPARNLLLIASAAAVADTVEPALIVIGLIDSPAVYPDTSAYFLSSAQAVLDCYFGGKVLLSAPLLTWPKSAVLTYARQAGFPIGITRSCQGSTRRPCGACPGCRDRDAT
jgi:7-cyano-7-deazaguanine synthase